MSDVDFASSAEVGAKVRTMPHPLRILVVDDNKPFAETLAQVLETSGDKVEFTYSGPDALEIARRFTPDVVFLDIMLPVMDGHEVCKRLRLQGDNPAMKVIAQSGYGDATAEAERRGACFDLHLTKPLNLMQLTQMLNDLRQNRNTDTERKPIKHRVCLRCEARRWRGCELPNVSKAQGLLYIADLPNGLVEAVASELLLLRGDLDAGTLRDDEALYCGSPVP